MKLDISDMSDPLAPAPADWSKTAMGRHMASFTPRKDDWIDAAEAGQLLGVDPRVVGCLAWRGLNHRPTPGGGLTDRWTAQRLGKVLAAERAEPLTDRDWVPPSTILRGLSTSPQVPDDRMLAGWRALGVRTRESDPPFRRIEQINCFDVARLVGIDPRPGP
jgi:hypothetical protein